ncbi:MAG: hypothetical protein LRS43_03190 [Desulfurococcales archaeon]|nr:hypothetical protein [Desulfurococcales archaeon]
MYSSNITEAVILEILANMARELENISFKVSRSMVESRPGSEALEKLYRQDIMRAKGEVQKLRYKLHEYLAAGRMGLVEMAHVYTIIADDLAEAMSSLELGVYMTLLLSSRRENSSEDVARGLKEMYRMIADASAILASAVRMVQEASQASEEVLKLLSGKITKIEVMEEDADAVYRKLVASILENYGNDPVALVTSKDVADRLEDFMDKIASAGHYVRLIQASKTAR